MASATAKPQKRLRDFLSEQQEPFILEVFLSEREYSKRSSNNSSEKSTSLNKRRKALLPFCKALTILHNKLGFNSESNILTRKHEQRKSHTDHFQFSSASGATEFNSWPHIGEGTSISSHKDHNTFSSHSFQTSNACNKKRQRQRCIKKQHLFDCVRDITTNFPTKEDKQHDYKQFMGLELGKFICLRTKDWGQHAGVGTNLTCLLTVDYLNSMVEWSKFEWHVTDISVDITDAILESINNEIVSEMVGTLVPNV